MAKRYKLVISDFIRDELEPEKQIIGDIADIVALDKYHEDELVGLIEDADAIMLYHHLSLTRKTLDNLKQCKLIVRAGVGVDNIDHAHARKCGIPVANVPDYGSEEVADTAMAMALTLARGVHYVNARLRAERGDWHYSQVVPTMRLRGRVFGIVGLGRIGSAVAMRAKAIGMNVVFYDPYIPDGYDRALNIGRAYQLDDLLDQVHILSMHCPHTQETHHMIDAAAIARMPRGSFLVNTARGAVVDVVALREAIASGQLAGAGIDVLETEPPSADDPLIAAWRDPDHLAHDRLIINPHSAFYCEEGLMEIREKGCHAIRQTLLNQPLRNVVN